MAEAVQQKTKNGGAGKKKKEETPVTVTLVLKVYMHYLCQGGPEKIINCVEGFEGVVKARFEANKLTVVGKKIDPSKLMERIFKETKKKVVLISPQPEKEKDEKKNPPKQGWKQRKVDNDNPTKVKNVKAMQPPGGSRGGTSNNFWRNVKDSIKAIVNGVVVRLDPTGLASILWN